MPDASDLQLLRAYRGGDESGFDALVGRHARAVKAYALRMLKSPEHAEEIYVETFLRVATAKGRWDDRGTVRGWIFTIAHRLCIDALRRRRTEREALPHLVALADHLSVRPSPEALAALGQRAERLEVALAALPDEHRNVLLLRTVHGLSAAEVAQTLDSTEEQVHSQLSYARKRLRVLLTERAATQRGSR